jgi:hypothetical protein
VVADVDDTVEQCRVINTSGQVTLKNDIQSKNEPTCLQIQTDDVILDGNDQTIEYNGSTSQGSGIRIGQSADNITVRNITVERFGNNIDVSGAKDVTLRNITTANASIRSGISTSSTRGLQIKNVIASNNIDYGIRMSNVSNVTVNNSVTRSNSQDNIRFDNVKNATIMSISAANSASGSGIYLNTSRNIAIRHTTASGNDESGVYLGGTKSATLQNLSLINNYDGVDFNQYTSSDLDRVVNSTGNKLINSSISKSEDSSVSLVNSQDNLIRGNQISDARIRVFSTDGDRVGNSIINISILDNSITNTSSGILIQDSSSTSDGTPNDVREIQFHNNTVDAAQRGNGNGVTLRDVTNITLRNNSISGFEENLVIEEIEINSADHSLEYFRHDIDTSNTVNGDPIYYRRNISDRTIAADSDAGFVGIVDSENVTARDLTLSNVAPGVLLVGSQNVTVQNISTQNTSRGVKGISLDNSKVVNSAFLSSNSDDYAVSLARSSNNTIQNNLFTQTKIGSTGIEIWNDSDKNLLANNTLQYDSSLSQDSFDGFRIGHQSDENDIISNTLTGASIDIGGSRLSTQRNTVQRNVIQNSSDDGIDDDGNATLIQSNQVINTTTESDDGAISGGSYARVKNNTVDQTDGSGIEVSRFATVKNNTITDSSDGIVLEGERSVARNNTIDTITEYGIEIRESNVTIADNRIRNITTDPDSAGIADRGFSDHRGSDIQNNNIKNTTHGLRLAGDGTFGQITDNHLINSNVAIQLISEDDSDGASNYTITNTLVKNPDTSAYRNIPRSSGTPRSTNTTVTNLTLSDSSLSFTERTAAIGPAIQPAIAPEGTKPLDIYLNTTNTTESAYINLTLNYTRANLSDVNESAIELYRYTGTKTETEAPWTAVSASKDAQANTISRNISTFGTYALFEENGSVEQGFKPLSGTTEVGNTTPELSGDLRVETDVESETTADLVEQTAKNYTLEITVNGSVSNITFYFNRSDVESNIGNLSNVSLLIAGTEQSFITRSPADRRWIGFELQQSQPQNRTVTFVNTTTELATVKSVSAQTGNGTLTTKLNTTGTLTEIRLNISNSTGTVQTLSLSSFTESTLDPGNITYTNTTKIADGSYNISLSRIVDETGTNISTGQTRRVTVTSSPAVVIANTSVRERTNPDENVTAGDTIQVNATVQGATTVTANASAFGASSNITMVEQSESNYTVNITVNTSATEGSSEVVITAANARNNDSQSTESLIVDRTPPAINNITLINNNGSISNAAPGDTVNINVSASDEFSTIQSVSVNATSLGAGTVPLTDSNNNSFYTGQFSINSSAVSDSGNRSVRVRANDTVGLFRNESAILTVNVSQDRTPPTLKGTSIFETDSLDRRVNDNDQIKIETEISDSGNASISDVSVNLSTFGAGEVQLTDAENDGRYNTTFKINATAVSDGTKFPTITAVDSAGNENTTTIEPGLIVDTAEPILTLDANRTNIQVGDTIRFNATDITPRGPVSPTVNTLQWDFDDDGEAEVTGSLDEVSVINRTFNSSGVITTTLTATDDAGNVNTTTVSITAVGQQSLNISAPDQIARNESFTVTVTDTAGDPVADANVTLDPGPRTQNITNTTTQDGVTTFTLSAPAPEVVDISASPVGLVPFSVGDQVTIDRIRDPDDISVTDITITQDQILRNDSINISVDITNTNPTELEETFVVEANESGKLSNETLSISGNASTTITLSISIETLGTQNITVNEQSAGTVTVEPLTAPQANLSAFRINGTTPPIELQVGDDANVSVNITNQGDKTDQFNLSIAVGSITQNTSVSSLNPGETRTVIFENVTDSLAAQSTAYNLTISTDNTTISGDITITPTTTGTLSITDTKSPARVSAGDQFTVSARVANFETNITTETVSFSLDIDDDGELEPIESKQITVSNDTVDILAFQASVPSSDQNQNQNQVLFVVETDNDTISGNISIVDVNYTTAVSTGDPHIVSFDGVAYDFQAAGEFTLAREPTGSLVVQARQEPVPGSDSVTRNTAVATVIDNQSIIIDATDDTPLKINGSQVVLNQSETRTFTNGTITRNRDGFIITYNSTDDTRVVSDEYLSVDLYANRIDIELNVDPNREKAIEGVFGSADGNKTNDIALPNGTALVQPPQADQLYGVFRQSWQVSDSTTLFEYEDDNGPETYYNSTVPAETISLPDLNPTTREQAEQIVNESGLQPGTAAFRNAVLDYALTNDASYIASAQQQSTSVAVTRLAGSPTESVVRVESKELLTGETTPVNLTLERAPEGLSGYNLTVSVSVTGSKKVTLSDASAPAILNESTTEASIGANNQTAEIRATDIKTVIEPDDTNIPLGSVTVAANDTANVTQVNLTVSVSQINDDAGSPVDVETQNGTLTIAEQPPLAEGLNPPTDLDNDGVLEDINGNGRLDFNDVVALFENLADAEVQFQDVNENGRIDFDDIVELFEEI